MQCVTSVIAILFVVSSIALAVYSIQANKNEQAEIEAAQSETTENLGEGLSLDEEGNLVDDNGNILLTAEDVAKAEAEAAANANAEAE